MLKCVQTAKKKSHFLESVNQMHAAENCCSEKVHRPCPALCKCQTLNEDNLTLAGVNVLLECLTKKLPVAATRSVSLITCLGRWKSSEVNFDPWELLRRHLRLVGACLKRTVTIFHHKQTFPRSLSTVWVFYEPTLTHCSPVLVWTHNQN